MRKLFAVVIVLFGVFMVSYHAPTVAAGANGIWGALVAFFNGVGTILDILAR